MESLFRPVYAFYITGLMVVCLITTGLYGCSGGEEIEQEVRSVSDEEASEIADSHRQDITVELANGLDIDLWASEHLTGDPVALHMTQEGKAFVTVTNRRYTSSLDIRNHPDWTTESLKMQHVDDRREFIRQKLATENSESNSDWLPDFNQDGKHDWRDLAVEEEEVWLIEDLSGNGYANRAGLFYRGFNEEITDLAGAVLSHKNDVFIGAAPDVWRIRDTRGDGMGDQKESISHGYGVHIGMSGHGLSGMVKGPDGRLYWSIGDIGLNVVDKEGKQWEFPGHGAILRSEPDGSNFEVFARGLRNTHEFVFDEYGNLITVDNDGDFPGEFERVVHLIDGSDSGWRINWQFGKYTDPKNNNYNVWVDERYFHPRFNEQAAHILPPLARYHNGPAGMAYNPGTALGEQWQNHFFVARFVGAPSRSGIDAFTLEPDGASFKLSGEREVMRGLLATGIDFGPDGAMYVADWIAGWDTNEEGRIWKMDTTGESDSAIRTETRQLLQESFSSLPAEELSELMGHEDMRVRQKAQFELADRVDVDMLLTAIEQDQHQLRRIHGIWGIGQVSRSDNNQAELLNEWIHDPDPEIRAQTARMLGDIRYEQAADELLLLLEDQAHRVRFFAAEALGRIEYRDAVEPIVNMLEQNDDEDVYLRQAGVIALARIGDADAVTNLSLHPSRAVRIAAVAALNRMNHPGAAEFLHDDDEFIVTDAARAINDDKMIHEALGDLAEMLENDRFRNEPLIRRAINASVFNGEENDAMRLAAFAARDDIEPVLRVEALEALSVWENPSVLDRVTGRYRGQVENDIEAARRAIGPVLTDLFESENNPVKIAAVNAAGTLEYHPALDDLVDLFETSPATDVRIRVLYALRELEYIELDRVFAIALEDESSNLRQTALEMVPQLDLHIETITELLANVLETGEVDERQTALEILSEMEHESAYDLLSHYLGELIDGSLDREIELDLVQAAERLESERLQRGLDQYLEQKRSDDPVSMYRESLYGGSSERGRELFYEHTGAQCIRCHVVDETGSDIGPDLSDAGSRLSREQLLQSMVDPNARLVPGYGIVTLILDDGQEKRGLLMGETDTTVTISVSDDDERIFKKNQIVDRVYAPSGMPPMGNILTRSELRDLVEYLSGLNGE